MTHVYAGIEVTGFKGIKMLEKALIDAKTAFTATPQDRCVKNLNEFGGELSRIRILGEYEREVLLRAPAIQILSLVRLRQSHKLMAWQCDHQLDYHII